MTDQAFPPRDVYAFRPCTWLVTTKFSKKFRPGTICSGRTENPRVRGSIPRPGTFKIKGLADSRLTPFSLSVTNLKPFLKFSFILCLPELNDFASSGITQFLQILLLKVSLFLPGSLFQVLITNDVISAKHIPGLVA